MDFLVSLEEVASLEFQVLVVLLGHLEYLVSVDKAEDLVFLDLVEYQAHLVSVDSLVNKERAVMLKNSLCLGLKMLI